MANYTILKADSSLIPSLTTILARSFHPVNPYIREAFPDTPVMREWWTKIFTKMLADDRYYLLTAVDDQKKDHVIGNLILRIMEPGKHDSGVWTEVELTEDHDREKWAAMFAASKNSRVDETQLLQDTNYLVDNFAVDHEWKSIGVGTAMLKRACEMADDEGLQMSVQANGKAAKFYERQGFEELTHAVMPGEEGYTQHLLMRPARKGKTQMFGFSSRDILQS